MGKVFIRCQLLGRSLEGWIPAFASKLLTALRERDQEAHDYAILSLFTGLRAGEGRDLTWADIDLDGGRIFVKDTKNKPNRQALITAELKGMLSRRAQGRSKTDPADGP